MKILLTIISVLCVFATGAQAQEKFKAEDLNNMCVNEMNSQQLSGVDIPEYCSCLSTRLARHGNKLEHTDGERARTQAMNDLQPCFDKHMRPTVSTLCQNMNQQFRAEKQKIKIDCSCYYDSMLDSFSSVWASNMMSVPMTPEMQQQLVKQGITKCMKEMP